MAQVFPDSPAGALPPEVLRAFRFLKGLPEGCRVWHHLAPWQKDAPDFLVLNEQQQGLLVKVSSAAPAEARPAAQLLLLADNRPPLGEVEARLLADFLQQLAQDGLPQDCLLPVVLFPNIPDPLLHDSRPPGGPAQPAWLGRDSLQFTLPSPPPPAYQTAGPLAWAGLFQGPSLQDQAVENLRARFTPEVVVPPALTVRPPRQRPLAAGLTGYLLDYDQETALKASLDLSPEGQSLARDFQLSVVNGVAGSGKTLILLYRLRLLYELYPGKRFLVLTHNHPLNHDLQARFYQIQGRLPQNIAWNTFNGWCWANWPEDPPRVQLISQTRRAELQRAAWQACLAQTAITPGMLSSEIDWIKDQPIVTRQAYLESERRGRGFRLNLEQRQRLFTAYTRYQDSLTRLGLIDWGDLPLRIWSFIQSGTIKPPEYDAVLVDEAQFFAPLWFEIVRRLVKPRSGHLFLAADPAQGFLRRGASWRSMGLEVRGHASLLRRSYRTTYQILDFATLFYRQRTPGGREDDGELAPDLFDMPVGAVPQLILLDSPQDEIARIANEVAGFAGHGLPLSHLLVLHTSWQGARALIQAICRKLGRHAAADPKQDYPGNYVRVTTLNAGTGLEAPIVFLAGLRQLFEAEQSLRLSDEEREEVILENTRKIYMAATRAGQRLVFTYTGELPEVLRRLLFRHAGTEEESP